MRNCALSMDQIQEYRRPLSPVGETPSSAYNAGEFRSDTGPSPRLQVLRCCCVSGSRQRAHSGGRVLAVVPPSPVTRRCSDPQLSPTANDPAHGSPARHPSYQSDLRLCPAGPPKPPTKSYVERLRVEEGRAAGAGEEGEVFSAPQVETTSSFRPSR